MGEQVVTKYTDTEDITGPVRMTRTAAIHRVAVLCGGISYGQTGTSYRFTDLERADHAKALLDALDPGCTGDVFADGRLIVMPTSTYDDQPATDPNREEE